jgi:acylphosphatase
MKGRRLRVAGRVQGVFFRNWTIDEARALGIRGWVRNRSDGSVEILALGDEEALDALLAKVRAGPRSARVERVDIEAVEEDAPEDFTRASTV